MPRSARWAGRRRSHRSAGSQTWPSASTTYSPPPDSNVTPVSGMSPRIPGRGTPVKEHGRPGPSGDAEELADPVARGRVGDRPALRVDVGGARAVFEEQRDDPALLLLRGVRAGTALSRVLDRE